MANKDDIQAFEKDKKVTLKKDVKWGNTQYKKGQVVIPTRNFFKYLSKNGLIEGFEYNKTEKQPDVRTRETGSKSSNKPNFLKSKK